MTPRERAVARTEAVFSKSLGHSALWDECVRAWEIAERAGDLLAQDQWGSDYRENTCHSCGSSERSGHQDDCPRAALLKELGR